MSTHSPATGCHRLAFELTDLIDFLQANRFPTGIQRVQLSLANTIINSGEHETVVFVCFDTQRAEWLPIDLPAMQAINELTTNHTRTEDDRRQLASALKAKILAGSAAKFPNGTALLNTGSTWNSWNYFAAIRHAKRTSGLLFIPFVHDCIPALFPQFCDSETVKCYLSWVTEIRTHADLVITNSHNTANDLKAVFAKLGIEAPPVTTTWLNGEFNSPGKVTKAPHNDMGEYVLMVSTLEPRKGHLLALNVWSRLLRNAESPHTVPQLVLAGNSGWKNEAIYQALESDPLLRQRVKVITNVPDHELHGLYANCLFTLFPSLYEGWGLPITEALVHGKVPIVSDVASHREAGGGHALYFNTANEDELLQAIKSLLDNRPHLHSLTAKVAAQRFVRPWYDIYQQIKQAINPAGHPMPPFNEYRHYFSPQPGLRYPFAKKLVSTLETAGTRGDQLRLGNGWQEPDEAGCRSRGESASLGFYWSPQLGNQIILYLHLAGTADTECAINITIPNCNIAKTVNIKIRLGALFTCHLVRNGQTTDSADNIEIVLACATPGTGSFAIKSLAVARY